MGLPRVAAPPRELVQLLRVEQRDSPHSCLADEDHGRRRLHRCRLAVPPHLVTDYTGDHRGCGGLGDLHILKHRVTVFEALADPGEVLADGCVSEQPDPGEVVGLDGVFGQHGH